MTTEVQERMAHARSFRKGKITTQDVAPVTGPRRIRTRTMTEEEAFLATNVGPTKTRGTTKGLATDDPTEGGFWEHTRPGVVLMWKPGPDGRYTPRGVSETSKGLNLQNGWKITCPDCGTNHEASALAPGDPNACPGRPKIAIMICPVVGCRKRLFDNQAQQADDLERIITASPDAEMVIRNDLMENTTPESRLLVSMHIHMWTRHPRQAMMRNLPPLSQAWLNPDLPDSARPV